MNTLYGKRVILFPFEKADFGFFDKLLTNGNKARMFEFLEQEDVMSSLYEGMLNGNFSIWVSKTIQGKASKPVGIVFVAHVNDHLHGIKFMPDATFLKGMSKYLWKKKCHDCKGKAKSKDCATCNGIGYIFPQTRNTYIEDTLRVVLEQLEGEVRVETKLPTRDVLLSTLVQKHGFKREGTLKKYALVDGEYIDISIYAKIKEDEEDGS